MLVHLPCWEWYVDLFSLLTSLYTKKLQYGGNPCLGKFAGVCDGCGSLCVSPKAGRNNEKKY